MISQDIAVTVHSPKDSYNQAIIMNRSVSTTLENLLDLIFRDLVESVLADKTHLKASKASSVKYGYQISEQKIA